MKHLAFALILFVTSSSLAATFTVINTNNTGIGSFRAAINGVNTNVGTQLIDFAIPPFDGTVKRITPLTPLPVLNGPVTIDGYTQDTAHSHPNTLTNGDDAVLLIELTGDISGGDGLGLAATNCVVRGLVINGFALNGISISFVSGGGATNRNCIVEGNFIGTDPLGTIKHGNGQGILAAEPDLTVGGTNPAARNIVSGNNAIGINIGGGLVTNVLCVNNFVGVDRTGTNALGNGAVGVTVTTSTKNFIIGNVISGNGDSGINLITASNTVQGNFIGTDLTGTLNLSNHTHGIVMTSGSDNTIGGAVGNVIAFNGGAGVSVSQGVPNRTNNLISANSIFVNGTLGIDIDVLGVTSNDLCDVDTGGNRRQNFPVLTNVFQDATGVIFRGFMPGAASTTYKLEFFANTACDPSGFGEGELFVGSTNITMGGTCTNGFAVKFLKVVPCSFFATATATDPDGNTSEFSVCQPATALDSDGDGIADPCETLAGTNPNDPASLLRITAITRTGTNVTVAWQTATGHTNRLQTTTGDTRGGYSNNFTDVTGNIITTTTSTNSQHIGGGTVSNRYYRVRIVP